MVLLISHGHWITVGGFTTASYIQFLHKKNQRFPLLCFNKESYKIPGEIIVSQNSVVKGFGISSGLFLFSESRDLVWNVTSLHFRQSYGESSDYHNCWIPFVWACHLPLSLLLKTHLLHLHVVMVQQLRTCKLAIDRTVLWLYIRGQSWLKLKLH